MAALAAGLAVAVFAACGTRPGDPCTDDAACGGGDLFCNKPSAAAANGVCAFKPQAPGGHCLASGDCASGSFCSNELSTTEKQFHGICTEAQTTAGAPCLRNANCKSPLACKGADGGLGTCQ